LVHNSFYYYEEWFQGQNLRDSEGVSIIQLGGKIPQVDIGVGDEAGQQNNRVDDKTGAIGHWCEKWDQEEPVSQIVYPCSD
jgi:hypothetical protein